MAEQSRRSRVSRMHDNLGQMLAVLVPLTAVPLASNRATLWLVWTVVLALMAGGMALRVATGEGRHRLRFPDYLPLICLALVLPLWAFVQTLPIAAYLPGAMTAAVPGSGAEAGEAISVQPEVAASGILRYLGYVVLICLVVEVASRRERVLHMAQVVFAGLCLQAIWAIVALKLLGDIALWGEKAAYLGSATGTFVNRNSLATFLGFGLVLGLGIIAQRVHRAEGSSIRSSRGEKWWERLGPTEAAIAIGMVFLFIALVYTQSRLGLAASGAGVVTTLILLRWRAGATLGRVLGESAVLVAVALVAVGLLVTGGGVAERLLFLGNETVNRLAIYRQTMEMIAMRPWTGFGMDAFAMEFEAFRRPPLLAPVTYDMAHNSYLMLWAEFGVIFGSVPLVALGVVAVLLWQRMRGEDGFPALAAAAIGALVLGAVHSAGDFSLEIPANTYLLMLILGLGLGRISRTDERRKQRRRAVVDTTSPEVLG